MVDVFARVAVPMGLVRAATRPSLVALVVKETYELHEDGSAQLARQQTPLESGSGRSPLGWAVPDDFTPPKPRSDFLLVGEEGRRGMVWIDGDGVEVGVGAYRTLPAADDDWARPGFDRAAFHAAPPHQRRDLFDFPIRLAFADATTRLEVRLNLLTPQAFVAREGGPRSYVRFGCDTLLFDPWRRVVTLVFRGLTEIADGPGSGVRIGVDPFGQLRAVTDEDVARWPRVEPSWPRSGASATIPDAIDEPEPQTTRPVKPAGIGDEETLPTRFGASGAAGGVVSHAPPEPDGGEEDESDPFARTVMGARSPVAPPSSPITSPSSTAPAPTPSESSRRAGMRGTIPIDRSQVMAALAARDAAAASTPDDSNVDDGTGTINVPANAPRAAATPFARTDAVSPQAWNVGTETMSVPAEARPASAIPFAQTRAMPATTQLPEHALGDALPFKGRTRAKSTTGALRPAPMAPPSSSSGSNTAPPRPSAPSSRYGDEGTLVGVRAPAAPTLPFQPEASRPVRPASPPSTNEGPPQGEAFDGRATLAFIPPSALAEPLPFVASPPAPASLPAVAPVMRAAHGAVDLAPAPPFVNAPRPSGVAPPPFVPVQAPANERGRRQETKLPELPDDGDSLRVEGVSLARFARIQAELWASPDKRSETLAQNGLSELRWRLVGKKMNLAIQSEGSGKRSELSLFAHLRENGSR